MPLAERDGGIGSDEGGELRLERIDVRPERRDPVGVERVEEQRSLGTPHMGRREVDAVHGRPPTLLR